MLDIFNDDAFSVQELTLAINDIDFTPSRLMDSGWFGDGEGITTENASIERQGNTLVLIEPTPRGGPGQTMEDDDDRQLIPVAVPHFEVNDSVNATEVSGVREFGTENQLETVQGRVARKLAKHVRSFTATTELSMIGAWKGIIQYKGGQTLDLFRLFGIEEPDVIELDFSDMNSAENVETGAFRKWCTGIIRGQAEEIGGLPWDGKVRALVGDDFFDYVLGLKEVRQSYEGWSEAKILREGYIEPNGKSYGAFEFADIIFENYRGKVGATSFIEKDFAHFAPQGVPDLFERRFAPADLVETVNTVGQRLYAHQYPFQNKKGVHLDSQMNELCFCSRPRVLRKAKFKA